MIYPSVNNQSIKGACGNQSIGKLIIILKGSNEGWWLISCDGYKVQINLLTTSQAMKWSSIIKSYWNQENKPIQQSNNKSVNHAIKQSVLNLRKWLANREEDNPCFALSSLIKNQTSVILEGWKPSNVELRVLKTNSKIPLAS